MYLKRLTLHGFKSFANRTEMDFSPGITAIVGPNGSGKSNVADALRWALGEQNMRMLRGKKSDDIIFVGGKNRAALGMAEVTLTIDNSSGWIPLDYSEISVSRRVFRTGEADYLINGAKVRLKDILALLSKARIGHDSYTIIGQGLVDQALSSKAEERRGLFEDAAGIKQHQVQRDDAEQKLAQTHVNIGRLRDILSEIEPRLEPLADQARKAQLYISTRAELDRKLKNWAGSQWNLLQTAMLISAQKETATQTAIAAARTGIESSEQKLTQLRTVKNELAELLTRQRKSRNEILTQTQTIERELAVTKERIASFGRALRDLDADTAGQVPPDALQATIVALEQQFTAGEEKIDATTKQLTDLESSALRAKQTMETEEARLRNMQRDIIGAQARLTAAQGDLGKLQKRKEDIQQKLTQRTAAGESQRLAAAAAQEKLSAAQSAHDTLRSKLADLLIAREELSQKHADAQMLFEQRREDLSAAKQELQAAQSRLAILTEIAAPQDQYAVIEHILENIPDAERPRVLGPLSRLMQADTLHETAIESALGPLLHAIVAESEEDAWRCAELLRQAHAPRVILVWPIQQNMSAQSSLAERIAAAILLKTTDITADTTIVERVAQALLADWLFIEGDESLQTVRFSDIARPSVMRRGEILHPAGWLATEMTENVSMLTRERELRELPDLINGIQLDTDAFTFVVAQSRKELETIKDHQRKNETDIKEVEQRISQSAKQLAVAQKDAEKPAGELQVIEAITEQMKIELETMHAELTASAAKITELEQFIRDVSDSLEEQQEITAQTVENTRARQEETAKCKTTLAVLKQEQKSKEEKLHSLQEQLEKALNMRERKEARTQELRKEIEQTQRAVQEHEKNLGSLKNTLQGMNAEIHKQEQDAARNDQDITDLDKQIAAQRVRAAQFEENLRAAAIEAQRARDGADVFAQQMAEELGAAVWQDICATADDQPTISQDDLSAGKRAIESLRNKLKTMGGFDPEAPKAYEELKSRCEFLTAQIHDMEEASAKLRGVIIELDALMRKTFEETFRQINERFQRFFTTLFRGGSARLELTAAKRVKDAEDDDGEQTNLPKKSLTGGVEIFAQIPGKKTQDLSLLSGGERAMVSAALLFALLETNPPPFCLLDEVDAALDESNVERFCDILEILAPKTQFIVITHNRVTMTHAQTIYGVSMSESVSRILSMRMAKGAEIA